jgi:hypothetical protein
VRRPRARTRVTQLTRKEEHHDRPVTRYINNGWYPEPEERKRPPKTRGGNALEGVVVSKGTKQKITWTKVRTPRAQRPPLQTSEGLHLEQHSADCEPLSLLRCAESPTDRLLPIPSSYPHTLPYSRGAYGRLL